MAEMFTLRLQNPYGAFFRQEKDISIAFCADELSEVFPIAAKAKNITLSVYDTPHPNAVRIRVKNSIVNRLNIYNRKGEYQIYNLMVSTTLELRKKFTDYGPNKTLYVVCRKTKGA